MNRGPLLRKSDATQATVFSPRPVPCSGRVSPSQIHINGAGQVRNEAELPTARWRSEESKKCPVEKVLLSLAMVQIARLEPRDMEENLAACGL